MVPPSNWAFIVTAVAPIQTITNTAANTSEELSPGAVKLSIVDNNKQTNSGPHKSQSRNLANTFC